MGGPEACTLPSTRAAPLRSCTQEEKSTSTDWLLVVALAKASSPATKAFSLRVPGPEAGAAFIMPV